MREDRHDLKKRNTLGSRLRLKRIETLLSAQEIAEEMGVCEDTIYKYERDNSMPDPFMIAKYVKLFNVSYDWLLYGDKKHG